VGAIISVKKGSLKNPVIRTSPVDIDPGKHSDGHLSEKELIVNTKGIKIGAEK